MSNRIYPIGIQNFEKIRVDGYFYVDKTALIYQMVKTGGYYFLSRPRRFGKSLLISTLEAYFSGKKELFEGLAMEKLEKDWIKYPVIHLDLNAKKFDTVDDLIRLVDRFYGVLKSMDGYIKFAMLTGVTKFGKVSVFSDLNNLDDISMRQIYVDLCGISEQELHDNLESELHELADAQGVTYDEICKKLRDYYDGYHFAYNSIGIYNPFSLLNAFKYQEFGSYWFETGTPTYLVELLKKHHYDLHRMAHEETTAEVLNSIDSTSDNPIPVIYQSGYLTIKGYDVEFGNYRLGFPNNEVEEGFIKFLLPFYASVNTVEASFEIQKFVREIRSGDYESFFRRLQSFFADTPYELVRDLELHYQNVLFIVFKLVGFYVKAEYHTSEGRVDLVLQTDKFIYVMEFKLNGTAEEALRQINEKHYALPFERDGRELFKIGVNFSAETRNIEKWLVESE